MKEMLFDAFKAGFECGQNYQKSNCTELQDHCLGVYQGSELLDNCIPLGLYKVNWKQGSSSSAACVWNSRDAIRQIGVANWVAGPVRLDEIAKEIESVELLVRSNQWRR